MSEPVTATGVELVVIVALPSPPAPQQYAAPAVVTAQVWLTPALSTSKMRLPETAPGVVLLSLGRCPGGRERLYPQRWAAPRVGGARGAPLPSLRGVNRRPPDTGTGVVLLVAVPFPSEP